MLPEGAIQASHIWKRFRPDRTRKRLKNMPSAVRAGLGRNRGWTWVLRDINFSLAPGESLGLIGANGSGKSTLLKILARVMYPYAGSVSIAGRVGALIEVAGGLHPELSGRENAFLQGSLLGMPRNEIAGRFDEIVAFAELESAIDRQVKYYSSGMKMRLGFSTAAFLNPAVLLVDEVLAVGDAAFQQKCMERMRDVLAMGTTLVLVSHDLEAVEATCTRGIWLGNGEIAAEGGVAAVMSRYRQSIEEEAAILNQEETGPLTLHLVRAYSPEGRVRSHQPLHVIVRVFTEERRSVNLYLGVSDGPAAPIVSVQNRLDLQAGTTEVSCVIRDLPLPRGRYFIWAGVEDGNRLTRLQWRPRGVVDVEGPDPVRLPTAVARRAPTHVDATWSSEKAEAEGRVG